MKKSTGRGALPNFACRKVRMEEFTMSYTLKATSDIVPSIKQHLWTSVEPSHPLIKTGSLSVVEFYFCFN